MQSTSPVCISALSMPTLYTNMCTQNVIIGYTAAESMEPRETYLDIATTIMKNGITMQNVTGSMTSRIEHETSTPFPPLKP